MKRKRSLLEDDSLVPIDDRRDEASPGDVCESCGCARRDHADDGESCKCGKCGGFDG